MKTKTQKLVLTALLAAIVVVLQAVGGAIHVGVFSFSLVLMPIVVGAALCGPLSGAVLGLVFAIMVFVTGDANAFLAVNPLGTVITVVAKGVLAGFVSGLVYTIFANEKNEKKLGPVMASAVAAPVVNTGLFLVGCLLFFMPTITEWAGGANVGKYMITGLVGVNFICELLINIILAPIIVRLIQAAKKNF